MSKNDTNIDKVVFIIFQPIWLLSQASSSLTLTTVLSSQEHCMQKRDTTNEALSWRKKRTREMLTVLITSHAHSPCHISLSSGKRKSRGNYECENALDVHSHLVEEEKKTSKSIRRLMEKKNRLSFFSFVHISIFSIQSSTNNALAAASRKRISFFNKSKYK